MDSNHRMSESKSDALPTWRTGYITGSHFMCYHYTNIADQAMPRIRTWPVFFTERFNKIAEKNLNGQK